MIVVLTGYSASGKSTIQKLLVEKGFEKIVTYTTRPPRDGEKDGEDYIFITNEQFMEMIEHDEFAEWYKYETEFGDWYYGSTMESYNDYFNNLVVILTPEGLEKAKDAIAANFVSYYLFVRMEILENRLKDRGDDEAEAKRRLASDKERFKNFRADHVVKGTAPDIVNYILETCGND